MRALPFVSGEEKQPVLDDRSANGSAERIPDKMRRHIRAAIQQFRPLIKPAIRLANLGAVVFVKRTMKTIGSTLGHQGYLRSRRSPCFCVGIRGGNPKLFERIQSGSQSALKGVA